MTVLVCPGCREYIRPNVPYLHPGLPDPGVTFETYGPEGVCATCWWAPPWTEQEEEAWAGVPVAEEHVIGGAA